MVRDATFLFAAGGVGTEVLSATIVVALVLRLIGVRRPAEAMEALGGRYALWLAALFAVVGTAVSLFFTSFADFSPGEVGWYTRICMYPLSILTVLMALAGDRRSARYLVPFPIAGMSLSVYGILLEDGVVQQPRSCVLSGPGGCTTKWINEFGYVTIPVLCLSTFFLILVFLLLALRAEHVGMPLAAPTLRPVAVTAVALGVAGVAAAAVGVAAARNGTPTHMNAGTMRQASEDGNAVAGRAVFRSSGCGSCHTLAAAGAHGEIGPSLDTAKPSFARVVATVTNGADSGDGAAMSPYEGILTQAQIADVARYVTASVGR